MLINVKSKTKIFTGDNYSQNAMKNIPNKSEEKFDKQNDKTFAKSLFNII